MAADPYVGICPNLLYTIKGIPINFEGIYRGASCFLIGGGPSLEKHDLNQLTKRGVLVAAMNNVAANHVRPNLWFTVDHPKSYCDNIWRDPFIMKFLPEENKDKCLFDRDPRGRLKHANLFIYQMPNVFYYRRNNDFSPERFLTEGTVNWGMHSKLVDENGSRGGRSVMYTAMRLLFYLGIRTVYLLGCDFKMEEARPYVFEQKKWSGGCRTNNQSYQIMSDRFKLLLPYFEKFKYKVFNCTEDSGLTAFPYKNYSEAVQICTETFSKPAITKDMYGE